MNEVQKRRQDLDPELYVNLVNRLQSQRTRRTRDNVVRFPGPTRQEEPIPDGLTAGGVFAILLAFLALTAVLILLGVE